MMSLVAKGTGAVLSRMAVNLNGVRACSGSARVRDWYTAPLKGALKAEKTYYHATDSDGAESLAKDGVKKNLYLETCPKRAARWVDRSFGRVVSLKASIDGDLMPNPVHGSTQFVTPEEAERISFKAVESISFQSIYDSVELGKIVIYASEVSGDTDV
ncbi:MAG: hypothetical protein ACI9BD_000265 [Candidatus Marinamargulisbacteria bacterium]|jgi:hypothetical protein